MRTAASCAVAIVIASLSISACRMSRTRYVDLLTRADSAMTDKQERLSRTFRIGTYPRYDYDEGTGILVFSDRGIARVLAGLVAMAPQRACASRDGPRPP